jgi:6-pyruvoyltetrahydropterin/6-carboxytetrahydropterin synthase
MYKITKSFSFDASHQLMSLPEGHKCKRLHGHTYEVIVELWSAKVNEHGFVIDFGDLDDIKKYIDRTLDHRHLNDVLPVSPSAENIAKYLFEQWQPGYAGMLRSVTVKETPKTSATYFKGEDDDWDQWQVKVPRRMESK